MWAAVGSDNLNRRSWTHDSEISCAIIDPVLDDREPADPGGQGDGARAFARNLRLDLWREHLGRDVPDHVLLDPVEGFLAWRQAGEALDAWHAGGRRGPRPEGRVRRHDPQPVGPVAALWAAPVYRLLVDPDGRPAGLKRAGHF